MLSNLQKLELLYRGEFLHLKETGTIRSIYSHLVHYVAGNTPPIEDVIADLRFMKRGQIDERLREIEANREASSLDEIRKRRVVPGHAWRGLSALMLCAASVSALEIALPDGLRFETALATAGVLCSWIGLWPERIAVQGIDYFGVVFWKLLYCGAILALAAGAWWWLADRAGLPALDSPGTWLALGVFPTGLLVGLVYERLKTKSLLAALASLHQLHRMASRQRLPPEERIDECLRLIAALIRNPLDRILGCLSFGLIRSQPTLWLMTPTPGQSQFNVEKFCAPGISSKMLSGYRDLQARHHPAMLDLDRYKSLREKYTRNGQFDLDGFRGDPQRSRIISISGWVYHYDRTIFRDRTSDCRAFDDSFLAALSESVGTANAMRYLRFGSTVALPVRTEGQVSKVLVAFKSRRSGFSDLDKYLLAVSTLFLERHIARANVIVMKAG